MWHHGTPNIGAPPQPLFAAPPEGAGRRRQWLGRSLRSPDGSAVLMCFGGSGDAYTERQVTLRPGESVGLEGVRVTLTRSDPAATPRPWAELSADVPEGRPARGRAG